MKKILCLVLISFLLAIPALAGTVSRHTTYATNSEVTATNLNGNFDNIVTVVNGGLDNDNANTSGGYRFMEVLGALPAAGTEGRVIFLTTNDTLNFDTGSAFQQTITAAGTPTQGDVIYYDGSAWARSTAGAIGTLLTSQGAGTTPLWQEASSTIVQVVNVQISASSTGTTNIPFDDVAPPQITEGDEYMTLAITPTNAQNKLRIDVLAMVSNSAANANSMALFQDTTADALAVASKYISAGNNVEMISLTHYMTAGTTSSTTFRVRIGRASTGTITFNGGSGARLYAGTAASSITITEIIP